jgi:mannose-6-phosphate isomerase-like protein (cupin superfamily)
MKGFKSNIEKDTLSNSDFRRVLYTGKNSQLVLMNLRPGEEIGEEVHKTIDQFLRFEKGEGIVSIDGKPSETSLTETRL